MTEKIKNQAREKSFATAENVKMKNAKTKTPHWRGFAVCKIILFYLRRRKEGISRFKRSSFSLSSEKDGAICS